MNKKRNNYSASEKAKIALAAIAGNMTMAEISNKYSAHATQIKQWKKHLTEHLPEIFSNKKAQQEASHDKKYSELYEQIGRLKVENEFLKKKCDLFT